MSRRQEYGPPKRKPEPLDRRVLKRASSVDAVSRALSSSSGPHQFPAGTPNAGPGYVPPNAPSAYRRSRALTYDNMPSRPESCESMSRQSHGSFARTTPRPQTPSQKSIISNASVPISAYVSPHAPSIAPSALFHMRNPHRPSKKSTPTGWTLALSVPNEPGSGSPIHAWLFFSAFLLFPLWWLGSFLSIPRTRTMGEDTEKVVVDDPQVEHDARSWRFRCRVMSIVSLFTYIPFIVLVVVFTR